MRNARSWPTPSGGWARPRGGRTSSYSVSPTKNSPRPTPSTRPRPSSACCRCSWWASCSAWPWTTRCSWSPACARNTPRPRAPGPAGRAVPGRLRARPGRDPGRRTPHHRLPRLHRRQALEPAARGAPTVHARIPMSSPAAPVAGGVRGGDAPARRRGRVSRWNGGTNSPGGSPPQLGDIGKAEPDGPDSEEEGPAVGGPHLGRADDREERAAGAYQRGRAFEDLAADHVERDVDLAGVLQPVSLQVHERVRTQAEGGLPVCGATGADHAGAQLPGELHRD